MYSREEYLKSTDCVKSSIARANSGLDWNYAIAGTIDRDLHEKLLPFDAAELLRFAQVLPLISSGYFCTAKGIVENLTVEDGELKAVRDWLLTALEEADEVG